MTVTIGSPVFGILIGLLYGTPVGICVSVVTLVVTRLNPRFPLENVRSFSAIVGVGTIAAIMIYGFMPPDRVLFRRHVIDPIPDSVSNLRTFTERGGMDASYIFRFSIAPQDLTMLISHWQLSKNGRVVGNEIDGQGGGAPIGYRLFGDAPSWWHLSDLTSPVVYERIVERGHNVYIVHGSADEDIYVINQYW